ncbi:MAG TPA: glutaredoxin family protein [Steroidobacteraceae bacterium]
MFHRGAERSGADEPRLTLLGRSNCGLCEEMFEQLRVLRTRRELPPLDLVDVDSDADLGRRFGLKIPVLLLDGVPVCEGRLDVEELERVLRPR